MLKKPPASLRTVAPASSTGDDGLGVAAGAAPERVSHANSRWRISTPCVASNTAASNETLLLL